MHEFLHGKLNLKFILYSTIFITVNKQLLALGFYHMQSAFDRDEYVQIHWENITPGMEHNFNKYNSSQVTHFNATYDYDSVMHYGAFGFSKNGNATIVPVVSKINFQRLF